MMNDAAALAGMLPYDTIGLYEQPKPRFIFKMPRVVPDQKSKFESDELFRRLSRESEVSNESVLFLFEKLSGDKLREGSFESFDDCTREAFLSCSLTMRHEAQ